MQGLVTIFWKELADHFSSKRFIILFLLVYLAGISAIYVAAQTIRAEVTETTEFVFLMLFTTSGGVLPPFLVFLAFFIPIVGIALGFDAVNSEKTSGNLSRLLSQPVYRDSVINGKFLAGLVTLSLLVTSIIAIVAGMGLRMIGVPPSSEEVLRLIIFLLVSIVYGAFWLALANLFSLFFDRTATSALAAIALWIFLFFFLFIISGFIADAIVPVSQDSPAELIVRHEEVRGAIERISPSTLYEEAVTVLLVPVVRSLSPLLVAETAKMLPNPLPFGQSLLLVWPHVTSLIALSALCFAASYVKFMREEIRSA